MDFSFILKVEGWYSCMKFINRIFFFSLFLNRVYFLKQFRFIAKLSRKYRGFPYTNPPHPHTCTATLHKPPPPEWCLLNIEEPVLIHHCHPKSTVDMKVQSWWSTFDGFRQAIMPYIHHYNSMCCPKNLLLYLLILLH